jgi:protoporphyrin/coproporphyrin ferrochelatase
LSPATAPHKFYVAFRYTAPFADDALRQMAADGVERAIAFSQYPQYSCTTTGSSLNDLWRAVDRTGTAGRFAWSIIDRWPTHPGFVEAMAQTVREGLLQYDAADRDKVLLMFSAHSLPLSVIDRGDAYPQEVGSSVHRVLEQLGLPNPSMLCYQSEVGPVRWLGPSTEDVIKRLAADQRHNVLAIPIAFTSDHIETLSELDLEYGELAHELGLRGFKRAPALNDSPLFLDAMADIVQEHLASGTLHSVKYRERCPGCSNAACRQLRDSAPGVATPSAEARAVA